MTTVDSLYYVGPDDAPDRYRLRHRVSEGGEAELWQAEVELAGSPERVAVKLLRPEHADDIDQWKARWHEQVTLLHLIDDPGVVRVHGSFECAPMHRAEQIATTRRTLCLVMNWVEGENLWEWIQKHASPDNRTQALKHLGQVAATLDQLHRGSLIESGRSIAHGDLSPGNVIINADGQAVLVDFGLFQMARRQQGKSRGTLGYVAPEVVRSGIYGPESDRYAFGALSYFVLSGGMPPPPDPAELARALAALPGIYGKPELQQHARLIAAEAPEQRPAAGSWIKLLRQQASTTMGGDGQLPPTAPPALVRRPAAARSRLRRLATSPVTVVTLSIVVMVLVAAIVRAELRSDDTPSGASSSSTTSQTSTVQPTSTTATTLTTTSPFSTTTGPSVTNSSVPGSRPGGQAVPLTSLSVLQNSKHEDDYPTIGKAVVNAQAYNSAVTFTEIKYYSGGQDCNAWADYNLNYAYSYFESPIGLDDKSPTNASVNFKVLIDGNIAITEAVGIGEAKTIAVPILRGFRMRLEVSGDSVRGECGIPVFARPQTFQGELTSVRSIRSTGAGPCLF